MSPRKQGQSDNSFQTAGEILPNGGCFELLAGPTTGELRLLLTTNEGRWAGPRIEHLGVVYSPLALESGLFRAIRLPNKLINYVSTKKLFTEVCQVFVERGFSEEVATIGTYFVFASWFPDCLPEAPCLLIVGPRPEASLFFQVLGCLTRRPLQLSELNRNKMTVLLQIQPTLLVSQSVLSPSKLKLLFASNSPNSYIFLNEGLKRFFMGKAIYLGAKADEDPVGDPKLRINLSPIRGRIPILDSKDQELIAAKFQPLFLTYRTTNIDKVRNSTFDFSWLPSGLRIIARILGACIVDEPELQANLSSFFKSQQRESREKIWIDKRCVACEVGLGFCHSGDAASLVFVGQFAENVSTVLRGRGQSESVGPKEMGAILRSIGFSPKRGNKGCALRLTDEIRRQIHKLAFQFDVASLLDGKLRCPHCREIFEADHAENLPGLDDGETPSG
jgi:hypothetical protein